MEKLLVVSDSHVAEVIQSGLGKEYELLVALEQTLALELFLKHTPKVVILDLDQPEANSPDAPERECSDSFRCLKWVMENRPATKVVVLVGKGDLEGGNRAVHCGAYDFHQKPVEVLQLKMVIVHAFQLIGIEDQTLRLQQALERSNAGIEGIAGQCAAIRELFGALQKVVQQPAPAAAPSKEEENWSEGSVKLMGKELDWQVEQLGQSARQMTLKEVRDRVEKGMITAAVGNCGGNIVKASELLGVSRPALYDLMKKHGLFKPAARN